MYRDNIHIESNYVMLSGCNYVLWKYCHNKSNYVILDGIM